MCLEEPSFKTMGGTGSRAEEGYGVLSVSLLDPGAVAEPGKEDQKHKDSFISRRSVFRIAHF